MLTRDFKFRVWYKDTDQMGIVHHSNYICYYEAARSELLRSFGSSYADMEEKDGVMMPILEVHSKYLRPAHYDELITVRISLRELPKARITFEYEIYNEVVKGKKEEELTPEEKSTREELSKKIVTLRDERNQRLREIGGENRLVKQIIDLALLTNGMLKGKNLTDFIQRSISLIGK